MRMLLKLYPRRIRNRYGDELLDLQDELRTQGNVSRTRMIRDTIAGAVLVRPARQRAHVVITAAVIVVVGLVIAGTIITRGGTTSRLRPAHPQARLVAQSVEAVPYGTCFVAAGSSCSIAPCTEFIDQTSTESAVADSTEPATKGWPKVAKTRCVAYSDARPEHSVVVARVATARRSQR